MQRVILAEKICENLSRLGFKISEVNGFSGLVLNRVKLNFSIDEKLLKAKYHATELELVSDAVNGAKQETGFDNLSTAVGVEEAQGNHLIIGFPDDHTLMKQPMPVNAFTLIRQLKKKYEK